MFVATESERERLLSMYHLLIITHLLEQPEIESSTAARICQRSEAQARDILTEMEQRLGYLERGGTGRGSYWTLRVDVHRRLAGPGDPERDRRIDWEAAKTRILSILMDRAKRGEQGLSNKEVRQITHFDRFQTIRLMKELIAENPDIQKPGRGRNARYALVSTHM